MTHHTQRRNPKDPRSPRKTSNQQQANMKSQSPGLFTKQGPPIDTLLDATHPVPTPAQHSTHNLETAQSSKVIDTKSNTHAILPHKYST